ncbi:MAG: M23 family metallopeptidase [Vicinamibacterales bacterium]
MKLKRYNVTIEEAGTGTARRFEDRRVLPLISDSSDYLVAFTITFKRFAFLAALLVGFPLLMAMAARWSAHAEVAALREAARALEVENASYRAAALQLTGQIASLQETVADLSRQADIDPASAKALTRLPSIVKSRGSGGAVNSVPVRDVLAAGLPLPEDTFGVLSEVLRRLSDRLSIVETSIMRRTELAAVTPTLWPAHGWLSGTFGRRSDPFTGEQDFHTGLDISADKGSPVYATADGTVASAEWHPGYGNLLTIDHTLGLQTRYGHLLDIAVEPGQKVSRGQVVARVGSTGRSTAPHLHYEILVNGQAINPFHLLLEPRRR